MPRITVAIPAYKPQFLGQAIASVLAQTFGDYELLISDDCPDGAVRDIVRRFDDPRIRLLQGPRNGLVPNSVNLWENAATDLLKYVYDDDFLLPFALAELEAALTAHPDAGFAFSFRHIVDEAGRIVSSPRSFQGAGVTRFEPLALAGWMVARMRNPIGEPSNLLIRRSAFQGSDCLSAFCGRPVRHMVDVAFYLNAARRGPSVGVPEFHAAFRRHAAQVTSQTGAPGFSLGLIEWELFIRGSVESGLADPSDGLHALPRLRTAYGRFLADFPELAVFRDGLGDLEAALRANRRDLLTNAFLENCVSADAAVEARRQSAA